MLSGCSHDKGFLYQDVSSRLWLGRLVTVGPQSYTVDSLESSFKRLPARQQTDTLYVTAYLTGLPSAEDRPFQLEAVVDSSNVPADAYKIGAAVLPANAFSAMVPVVVQRNAGELDLAKVKARLVVRLVPNAFFLTGVPGTEEFKLLWSDFLPEPPEWGRLVLYLGPFSQARYKFILDFYGEIDFQRFVGNINLDLGLQSTLRKILRDYNADPTNAGRTEGWPYLDDNGSPLTF